MISIRVSDCRWKLFFKMFCYKERLILVISYGLRSAIIDLRVFVLFVRTLMITWSRLLMIDVRHFLWSYSNFPCASLWFRKNPIPRVEFDAIFSLSLEDCEIK